MKEMHGYTIWIKQTFGPKNSNQIITRGVVCAEHTENALAIAKANFRPQSGSKVSWCATLIENNTFHIMSNVLVETT
jgi:hypothetical protein